MNIALPNNTKTNYAESLATAVNGVLASGKAAREALKLQPEGYHVLMGIKEFGEEAVLLAAAKIIQKRDNTTFGEAVTKAAGNIEYVVNTACGNQTVFKEARDCLKAAKK